MSQLNDFRRSGRFTARGVYTGLLSYLLINSVAVGAPVQAVPPAISAPASDKGVEWRTDLDATLAEAKLQNKLVLLRFTADWCPPCRVMDARVWPDAAVQATLADRYLIVKSDIDIEANQLIARKYGVQAVPTLIVLNSNGEEVDRGGFMSSQKLTEFLKAAAKTVGESDPPGGVSS